MSVSFSGQGSRDKSRTPKPKALPAIPVTSNSGTGALIALGDEGVSSGVDSTKNPQDRTGPGYVLFLLFSIRNSGMMANFLKLV